MKTRLFLVVVCLLASFPAFAVFCTSCGTSLPDQAKFCAKCGGKLTPTTPTPTSVKTVPVKHSTAKPVVVKVEPAKTEPAPTEPVTSEPAKSESAADATFRTKTDLYIYDKRGDEHNVLKKNLFFKPRRNRVKANGEFRILESVGDTFLIKTCPDPDGLVMKGWVTQSELELRTTWKK